MLLLKYALMILWQLFSLVQKPSNLPVPLSLDEGSVPTLQGANVPTSFDLLLASILDSSLSPYGQDVQKYVAITYIQ
jgi:hypothetical protein